jgi:hypothetical protein
VDSELTAQGGLLARFHKACILPLLHLKGVTLEVLNGPDARCKVCVKNFGNQIHFLSFLT